MINGSAAAAPPVRLARPHGSCRRARVTVASVKRASVLVADGDAPIRVGLRLALEAGGFEVCSEVETASDAVATALREQPDICVLDVSIPGNGIDAARTIAAKLPDTAVVMLTSSPDDEDLFAALRAGACGYLPKEIDPDRLTQALDGVL